MRITKLENNNELKVELNSGSRVYLLNGDFHRGGGQPAVITEYSEEYFPVSHILPKDSGLP